MVRRIRLGLSEVVDQGKKDTTRVITASRSGQEGYD